MNFFCFVFLSIWSTVTSCFTAAVERKAEEERRCRQRCKREKSGGMGLGKRTHLNIRLLSVWCCTSCLSLPVYLSDLFSHLKNGRFG